MANSINSRPDSVAHLPRHGHNLSHDFAFTSPVGYLLPVEYDFLFPGDKVYVDFNLNTVTNPLSKPCMTKIKEHIDVFFVPLRKLRTVAPEVIMNVDDLPTSYITKSYVSNGQVFPSVSFLSYGSVLSSNLESEIHDAANYTEAAENARAYVNTDVLPRVRLLEHLGYNPDIFANGQTSQKWRADDYQPQVSLMMLCAYQAIYYDYYRLSNFFSNNVSAYNVDFSDLHPIGNQDLDLFLELHSRPYKRDYFKNIEPSPLQSSLGVLRDQSNLDFSSVTNYLFGGAYGLNGADGVVGNEVTNISVPKTPSTKIVTNSVGATQTPLVDNTGAMRINQYAGSYYWNIENGGVNTISIRTAFAIEKLLRVTQRAGKHYDDQVAAHFGVKVPKGIANEVIYLGSKSQLIEFGTVISTAATDDSPLGNLAGRGYSKKSNGKRIKFKAPCHGVLMAIYSAEPDILYHTGLDKIHTLLDIYDFPVPEFDKLGMQPLFAYERRAAIDIASERLGWQFRYANFKQKYDRCTYAFTNHDYGKVTLETEDVDISLGYGRGAYAPYVISDQNSHLLSSASRYRNSLIVSPNDTDQIFLVGFDPAVILTPTLAKYVGDGYAKGGDVLSAMLSSQYTTDPLIHLLNINYKKQTFMSTFGEPEL